MELNSMKRNNQFKLYLAEPTKITKKIYLQTIKQTIRAEPLPNKKSD